MTQFLGNGCGSGRVYGDISGTGKLSVERLAIWRIRKRYEKGSRHCRTLCPSVPEGCLEEGLEKAVQKWDLLPEAQNDMIFSIICEELGLVGASLIILLFLILIWRFL